jgi:hypothetical protein
MRKPRVIIDLTRGDSAEVIDLTGDSDSEE